MALEFRANTKQTYKMALLKFNSMDSLPFRRCMKSSMEFKQIQSLFGRNSLIKRTIVYSVCRVQKPFDWMEIKAVLEALREEMQKNIFVPWDMSFFFLMILTLEKSQIIFVVVRIWTELSLFRSLDKISGSLEKSKMSVTSFYKVALCMELWWWENVLCYAIIN